MLLSFPGDGDFAASKAWGDLDWRWGSSPRSRPDLEDRQPLGESVTQRMPGGHSVNKAR
jgi:hypothetical protein